MEYEDNCVLICKDKYNTDRKCIYICKDKLKCKDNSAYICEDKIRIDKVVWGQLYTHLWGQNNKK